ncbi:MAG: hypothetical protein IKV80_03810 [Bacteroidales bacterium]|nr:hypothetical protein [Bacteroidales bacterium]
MANITAKTNKKGLIEFIKESVQTVKDEGLLSRINYTLKGVEKNEAEVAKSDLYDLAKEIMSFIAPAPQPAVENSPKPKLGKKKVAEPVAETPEEAEEEETTEEAPAEEEAPAPEKKTKKVTPKKEKSEPAKVVATDGLTKKDLPMARIFPKEIDHESLGKLVACPDKYHTIQEIREAIEGDKNLIFACYWTKRHIKEFAYGQSYEVPVPKGGFPHDLDTLQALYVCEGIDRIYALSTYTEAMFRFIEEDLVPTECEANDGSKFMMRYSAGLEFEIYEVVEA